MSRHWYGIGHADLLNRLPEGDFYASQNHNVPRVATGASSR